MTPVRAQPEDGRWPAVAALIHREFAYMEPILGHPPAAAGVTAEKLAEAARSGTAYLIDAGAGPVACLFTRPSRDMPDALYLGWLAVDARHRGQGLARRLIDAAEAEARAAGYVAMTLDTGRALTDLHRVFARAGFVTEPGTGEVVTFRKPLG